ncbi:hypothetical protein [Dyadobacter soli]|uniref:hypothetical protein n=1 Tax=Dyadobacter soli TaxID=659014 RepID=UPI000B7FE188|nr:hypothetical protein [Dyadobacter soli]
MKKRTPDSCLHNPNATSTIQDVAPVTIRSDPAVSSDHLVDVHEAKRMLKRVFAKKALLPLREGKSAIYPPGRKALFFRGSHPALAPQD